MKIKKNRERYRKTEKYRKTKKYRRRQNKTENDEKDR